MKSRLFVGEGDFSFTEAFANKHPEQVSRITATECYDACEADDRGIGSRLNELARKGVTVELGVDAKELHERFKGKRFERIHWNLPWDGAPYDLQTLPELLKEFFFSCRHLQISGDRVHVSIPQPRDRTWKFHQGYATGLVKAATYSGYSLYAKSDLIDEHAEQPRYPGYQTRHNSREESVESAERRTCEFVFKKFSEIVEAATLARARELNPGIRIETEIFYPHIEGAKVGFYYDCSTDEDSSSDEEL